MTGDALNGSTNENASHSRPPQDLQRHVELITGNPDGKVWARLIHDQEGRVLTPHPYGAVADMWPQIEAAQADGFGVFVVVNEGGNDDASITRIRALFIDADGIPTPHSWHVQPDFLVIRDAMHWHAYWRVHSLPVAEFKQAQHRLAAHYGTDPAVCNPSRVMRLAGTLHLKGEPKLVTLADPAPNREGWELGHTADELLAGLPDLDAGPERAPSIAAGEPISRDDLRTVLSYLDPDVPRAVWLKHVAAIRAAPVPNDPDESFRRQLAQAWSAGELDKLGRYASAPPSRYTDAEAVDRAFDTMPPKDGGAGVGSLIQAAREAGFCGQLGPSVLEWVESIGLDLSEPEPEPAHAWHVFDPWARIQAPPFPLDALPEVLWQFVTDQAAKIGADPSALAMAALAACSGAISHRIGLNLLRNGEWWVHPRLWVLLVGAPSTKKTPIMNTAVRALRDAEAPLAARYHREFTAWELGKAQGVIGPPPEPHSRFIVNDVTVEKLGDILSHQSRGVLSVSDELAGWLGRMEKYGGGRGGAADRAFWLQAWNGGPYSIDRIGRGSIFVENLSVAMLGGIQPARLAELTNLSSDGLLQRFLPVMMRPAEVGQDIADAASAGRYAALIERMTQLGTRPLVLSPEAYRVARQLEKRLHELAQIDALGERFATATGKLMDAFGALAILLHLTGDPEGVAAAIPEETATAAAKIVREFIVAHLRAFYDLDNGEAEEVRALASYVLTNERERFVPSDFTTGVRALRGLATREVVEKVSVLVAGGWLLEEGLPTRAWTIVPGLREHLAARRAEEIERKRRALELIKTEVQTRRLTNVG